MIQSKTIDILAGLSKKEFVQFGKFLSSGVFTSNKKLTNAYNHLKKYYPSFTSQNLTKENLYKAAYAGTAYNDASFRKLMSDMFRETEKFIVILKTLEDKAGFDSVLLKQFDERKHDNLFLGKYDELYQKLHNKKPEYSDLLDGHLLEWDNIQFHLERGMQNKISLNTHIRSENMIFYALCDTFLTLQDIITHKNNYSYENPVNLPKEFISSIDLKKLFAYIEKNNFHGKDIVTAFYLAYEAFTNFENEEYYYKFKDYALKQFEGFNIGSQRTIAGFLTNYCIRKKRVKPGKVSEDELYEVYKLHLKYKLYKINKENYIRSDFFFNIITYFYENGKVTELKEFIDTNINSIQPGHRKNIIMISSALIEFESGNFEQSLRQASMMKSNVLFFKQKLKVLILKNHFELGNIETAIEAANNMRHFLDNAKEISPLLKEGGYKFLHYYNLLLRKLDGKNIDTDEVKKELLAGWQFPESKWVIKKLDGFAGNP